MAGYSFRTGSPVAHKPLVRARDFCHSTADCITLAMSQDGHSDVRRDDLLDDAACNLREALRLIDEARHPAPEITLTPDQVRRADLVATCMSIAGSVGATLTETAA